LEPVGDGSRKCIFGDAAAQDNDLPMPGVIPERSLLFPHPVHFPLERSVICVTLSHIADLMINLRAIKKCS
jgi:hypothetical protein